MPTQTATRGGDPVLNQVGTKLLLMARERTSPGFLMRRFDSVEFIDATTARRTVACHLSLNALREAEWPLLNDELLIPLARLRRHDSDGSRTRTTLRVSDEGDGPVPTLTSLEERTLVNAGVWQTARHLLRRAPSPDTTARIGAIVLGEAPPDSIQKINTRDKKLVTDARFRSVLLEAYERFYLIVPLVPGDYSRRVITYTFDEQPRVDKLTVTWRRLLKPQPGPVAFFETPSIADCHSYHFELHAPPDVSIPPRCGRLEVRRGFQAVPDTPIPDDDRSERRLHVYFDGAGPIQSAFVKAQLVPTTTGMTVSMSATVFATSLLILLANIVVWTAPQPRIESFDRDALVTLLLVGPAIATTILAIRSGHELSSRMSWGTKATLILPTLALFAGSLVVTTDPQITWMLKCVWGLALAAAALSISRWTSERLWIRRVRKGKA